MEKQVKSCFYFFFIIFHISLFTFHVSWAAEPPSKITADILEHFKEEDKYVATGNVIFEKDKTVVHADKAVFFEKAAHLEAEGHVIYEDQTTLINAERAELNTDTKTGTMYNALILLKDQKGLEKKGENMKVDVWINSNKVNKIDDSHYYASEATFTSCETIAESEGRYIDPQKSKAFEPDSPDWCFKGSNVDILVGERITGDNMIYRIKGLPVAYFPFFRAPAGSDRETGFLSPVLGHTTVKGFEVSPAFYWAIDENKDATFSLDYFSKRGMGEGIEYRYLDTDAKGKWYLYHLYDTLEKKTDYVVRGTHTQNFGDIKVMADVNYVNQWDYYNQFGHTVNERIERYTQSSAEVSMPFTSSRLYMLGQYWNDLQIPPAMQTPPLPSQPVPQRLPELGYVVHPTNFGPLLFTMNSSIADFVRSGDVSGQRLDFNPKLWYTFGDAVRVFQSVGLRETAYNLSNIGTTYSSNPHRETYEYDAVALTRFVKQFETGVHIIEPSISFSYSPGYSHPLPLFDSVDVNNNIYFSQPLGTYTLLNKTSVAQFSLLSTLSLKDVSISARVIQPYEFNPVSPTHPLQPTTLWLWAASGPVGLSVSAAEDLSNMREQSSTATLSVKVAEGATVAVSRFYALTSPLTDQYGVSFTAILSKAWTVNGSVLYNQVPGEGLQTFMLHTIYTAKCWGLDIYFQRTPPDTIHPQEISLQFVVSLKGLGGLKLGGFSSPVQ